MNRPLRIRFSAVFGISMFSACGLIAQMASSPLASTKDDTVVLSPFTVSAEKDVGFVAASSLERGRLPAELKDTAVSYSVITRDFIDELGVTNSFDASDWALTTVKSGAPNG